MTTAAPMAEPIATPLEAKLRSLEELLSPMRRVLIAYSGGVDSAMLAVG